MSILILNLIYLYYSLYPIIIFYINSFSYKNMKEKENDSWLYYNFNYENTCILIGDKIGSWVYLSDPLSDKNLRICKIN